MTTSSPTLIVGAGIFGATLANRLAEKGQKVLIIDRRPHLAGNIYSYTDQGTGIEVHAYGSHIFHTESEDVWNFITNFSTFNSYTHTVHTRYQGRLYPMPINLDTVNLLYGTNFDAEEAEKFIAAEAKEDVARLGVPTPPRNFEEQGITLVGEKLYTAFLKGYTEKQWHAPATTLSADILKRIPVRFSHDARYFMTAKYQGIPEAGYTKLVENLLASPNIEVRLGTSFQDLKPSLKHFSKIIYCGQLDELLDYQLGVLPYRSLKFETVKYLNGITPAPAPTSQSTATTASETIPVNSTDTLDLGEAVINEADPAVPYTRSHDYKYYQVHNPAIVSQPTSIISREYPADFNKGGEAYYPVNNPASEKLYQSYLALAQQTYPNLVPGGRLGAFRYWDMDLAIKNALDLAQEI